MKPVRFHSWNISPNEAIAIQNNLREKIIFSSISNDIVITHGTDTMTKTCGVLANAKLKKTIVLTGAMIPYEFGSSDGLFNIGGALAFAQSLSYGVYVAMNGRYFQWDEVQKNKETGVFELKST